MQFEGYILEAVERALDWGISSDALAQAVRDQAALMAKISPEQHYQITPGLRTH